MTLPVPKRPCEINFFSPISSMTVSIVDPSSYLGNGIFCLGSEINLNPYNTKIKISAFKIQTVQLQIEPCAVSQQISHRSAYIF